MRVLEEFICGKNERCEDGIFYNDDFVVVVDGATSKGDRLWDGLTSGEYAKNIIIEMMRSFNREDDPIDILNKLSLALDVYDGEDVITEERLRACILIYSDYYKKIYSYGDCQFLINNKYYCKNNRCNDICSEVRSKVIDAYIEMGMSEKFIINNDIGRSEIVPLLKIMMMYENSDAALGFGCLSGREIKTRHLLVEDVKKGDVIVMASDGYPRLFDTLSASEEFLNHAIVNDPICYKIYKSTKGLKKDNNSFDDRCYIKFEV